MNLAKRKLFTAKILLFGEYTILNGGAAIVTPYDQYSGYLDFHNNQSKTAIESNLVLKNFLLYLNTNMKKEFNLPALEVDIEKGMFFNSNIPQGYGVGSSGALVAALYSAYGCHARKYTREKIDTTSLSRLKAHFSYMESWFHGKSSGIDPLCSFLGKPFSINDVGSITLLNEKLFSSLYDLSPFLIDTGQDSNTAPLIQWFNDQSANGQLNPDTLRTYSDEAIAALLVKNDNLFRERLLRLSDFQINNLLPMIPETVRELWRAGLANGEWTMKLCGSGGGGFMLGFTKNLTFTQASFQLRGLEVLPLSI